MASSERWQEQVEAQIGRLDDQIQAIRGELIQATAAGVREGIMSVLRDDELCKRFWSRGFDELAAHGANRSSQWIGKRLLVGAVTAIVTYGLYWLVKNDALK